MYVFISFRQYDLANNGYQLQHPYYTICQLSEVSSKKLSPIAHFISDLAEWPDQTTNYWPSLFSVLAHPLIRREVYPE